MSCSNSCDDGSVVASATERAVAAGPLSGIRARAVRASAWSVAAVALAVHGVWIASYLAAGHQARDFIKIGTIYERASHRSSVIKIDPNYTPPRNREMGQGNGYDGQFSYYMALDFTNARYYMDFPAYRYSRLLYPVVARATALGDRRLIPTTMIVINWLALGGLTLALAAWLRRRSCSPWLALLAGLYPGLLVGLQRDLTEPLAYALVTGGIYLFDYGGSRRLLWSGVVFGLAGLSRQTTLVFPICLLPIILLAGARTTPLRTRARQNLGRTGTFAALSILPFLAYLTFLYVWLGSIAKGTFLESLPFIGLALSRDWAFKRQGVELISIVAPSLILAGAVLGALRHRVWRVEFGFLLANVILFVVLLHRLSYGDGYPSAGRITSGVVVAAVVCIPWLYNLGPLTRRAMVASFALWLSMLPVIFVYGFGG
jgi:hypothetical protein